MNIHKPFFTRLLGENKMCFVRPTKPFIWRKWLLILWVCGWRQKRGDGAVVTEGS